MEPSERGVNCGNGWLKIVENPNSHNHRIESGIHSKKEGKTYAGFNLPKSCVMIRFDF